MNSNVHIYPLIVKETDLDVFGHVNNAKYLTLFEEARWELITQNNYGLKTIREKGLGPVILAIQKKFLKELRVRDEIVIKSFMTSVEKSIGKMRQEMWRGEDLCCEGEFTFGLFSLEKRKLVPFTPEWLAGLGLPSR